MKRGSQEIKAILLDMGGVLALSKNKNSEGIHNYIAKKLNITLDTWMDAADTNFALSIEGKITRNELLNVLSKKLKRKKKELEKIFHDAYRKNFKLNKQLFKQTLELKKHGYKIAILSDQWYFSKEVLIPKELSQKFDAVVISCDVKTRKPNKDIYQLLIKKLKLKPSEILFVDNRHWNISPAEELGMKSIVFENNKQLFKHPLWTNL